MSSDQLFERKETHSLAISVISKHQNDLATYDSLDARSNALARGLQSVGVKKGDRVGVMLGNSMEYVVVRSFLGSDCSTRLMLTFKGDLCPIQTRCYLGQFTLNCVTLYTTFYIYLGHRNQANKLK